MSKYQDEPEAPENHERYLVTYSDLITLLLALFIIMYSMASVDAQKYSQVSAAFADALGNGQPDINVGQPSVMDGQALTEGKDAEGEGEGGEQAQIENLENKINELVDKHGLTNYITVTQEERGLDIEVKNELIDVALFDSGSAEINPEAIDIMVRIGQLLKDLPNNHVRVEGHTDNVPINTPFYKSNWELSTSRATNVVKLLINSCGINPTNLSVVGYGEYKPVSENSTLIGKSKNRRVNIVIMRSKYNFVEN